MKTIQEIKNRLHSNDINVLKLCEVFINSKLESEHLRGESAERRANILIGTMGAASAFLVFLAKNSFSTKTGELITLIYCLAALWLARSLWYSMRSIRTQSRYKITSDIVFEVQEKPEIEALRTILASKVWELEKTIQPNTERLFYVQRGQRALITFVGLILLLGLVSSFKKYLEFGHDSCLALFIACMAILFWAFGDRLLEKTSIWN